MIYIEQLLFIPMTMWVFWLLVLLSLSNSTLAHKKIYIFGAESSGTRFLSSGVAFLFDNEWSGLNPGCRYISRELSLQHVSLPSNGRCDGKIVVIPNVDKCSTLPTNFRWFANITNVLSLDENALAIIITRDSYFTQRSIAKNHCSMGSEIVKMEFDTSTSLINHALETFPTRTLLISYEVMSLFPTHEWYRIESFLNLKRRGTYKPFRNGNK